MRCELLMCTCYLAAELYHYISILKEKCTSAIYKNSHTVFIHHVDPKI